LKCDHLLLVIPAERRQAREPGPKIPRLTIRLMPATWIPDLQRTTPLRFALRCARDDNRMIIAF